MLFKLLFNIVGLIPFLGSGFVGLKAMLLAVSIKNRNERLIGRVWNGSVTLAQMEKLLASNKVHSKKNIEQLLFYRKMGWIIIIGGFILLIVIGFLNGFLTHGRFAE